MKNSIPNAAKISPTDFVIFGGGGDLSIRKIIPALFWRFVDKQIDSQSNIIICLHKKTELETILNLIKPHTFNSIYLSKTLQNNWKNFYKLLSLITLDLVTGEGINDLILLIYSCNPFTSLTSLIGYGLRLNPFIKGTIG